MHDENDCPAPKMPTPQYIVLDARESLLTSVLRDAFTVASFALLAWLTKDMPFWRVVTAILGGIVLICMLGSALSRQRLAFHSVSALKEWADEECARAQKLQASRE